MWFVFTDIQGSTRLWRDHGQAMGACLATHDHLVRATLDAHGGQFVKHTGDGVFAVFPTPHALAFGLELQERVRRQDWGEVGRLLVKVAITSGEAQCRGGDYFGPVVNRACRLAEAAWGGQVLVEEPALAGLQLPAKARLKDLGLYAFLDEGLVERIYQVVGPGMPLQEFPPLKSRVTRPGHLPAPPTPFIGRERELGELKAQLDEPSCRLLTLWGGGGAGKTRLALRLAEEVADRFVWGAYFVPLASISSPQFVAAAIWKALSLSTSFRRCTKAELLDYLGDKRMLLVLDNFEHLLPGGRALVVEILESAPQVTLVVTSREPLHLKAEAVYPVKGMTVPPSTDDEGFERHEAVRLLVAAIRRQVPSFQLRPQDRSAVLSICRLVEGLPLALELVASWSRVMVLAPLAAELQQTLGELATEAADMPERHRSLRALFESSCSLLPPQERRLLERLSVFRGGWTLEACRAVAEATIPTLAALVDKSLVRVPGEGRYELQEYVRVLAGERLATRTDEHHTVAHRHMGFYLDLLVHQAQRLAGQEFADASACLRADMENIWAAWEHAVRERDVARLSASAEALVEARALGTIEENLEGLLAQAEAALDREGGDVSHLRALASMQISRGTVLALVPRAREAESVLRRGVRSAVALADRRLLARGLWALGVAAVEGGLGRRAVLRLRGAQRLAAQLGDRGLLAAALVDEGVQWRRTGAWAQACGVLRRAQAVAQESGDLRVLFRALLSLGCALSEGGQLREGLDALEEARGVAARMGDARRMSYVLGNLGHALTLSGDYEQARSVLLESLRLKQEEGDLAMMGITYANLARVSNLMERHEDATKWAQLGVEGARERGEAPPGNCLVQLAWAQAALGRYQETKRILAALVASRAVASLKRRAAEVLLLFAMCEAAEGRVALARHIAAAILRRPPSAFVQQWASQLLEQWRGQGGGDVVGAPAPDQSSADWEALLDLVRRELDAGS